MSCRYHIINHPMSSHRCGNTHKHACCLKIYLSISSWMHACLYVDVAVDVDEDVRVCYGVVASPVSRSPIRKGLKAGPSNVRLHTHTHTHSSG